MELERWQQSIFRPGTLPGEYVSWRRQEGYARRSMLRGGCSSLKRVHISNCGWWWLVQVLRQQCERHKLAAQGYQRQQDSARLQVGARDYEGGLEYAGLCPQWRPGCRNRGTGVLGRHIS